VIQTVFEKLDMVLVVKVNESGHGVDLASRQAKRKDLAESGLEGNFHGDDEADIFGFLVAFQLHDDL